MLDRFNHRFNHRSNHRSNHRRRRGGAVGPQRDRSRSLRIESLERRELLAGDLAITELMAANSSILEDTDHETPDWVEIHNAGTERVDLTGWRLTDSLENLDKWEFPTTFIEPDQYLLVLASGKDRLPQSYLLTTDLHATANATFAVDLPAGEYTLQVTMGDADRARDSMAIYVQGELRETFSAQQREFVVNTLPAEVSEATGGQLLLRIEDLGGETLRAVINALTVTSATGDATWQFDFGEATSPVEPGYVAVTADDTYTAGTGFGWLPGADISDQDRGLTQSELHTNFQLSAAGESVALVSPAGDVISAIGSEPDGYPPQYADISYGVMPATNPGDPPRVGYFLTPSPGAANDVNRMIAGPAIRNVTDSPGLLDDHEDLVVTATIDPTNAEIASAALTYRVMFGSEVIVPMVDDGTGSDITAGDGVFTGVIPHTASVPGEMLRWYVTAVDTVGYGNRAPLFTAEFDAPEYFGTVIGDPTVESNLPVLHWFVENTSAAQTRNGTHTSMLFRDKFYDNIYANLHGQSTSGGSFPKKSFNIDLNPGHRFEFAADQAPVTDFNMLTNYADKTKVRNTLGYETYRDADHAHHIAFPIRVQRNGSFFSLHDWVGEGGEEYLERLGIDPKGALYKVNNPLNSTTNNVEKRTRKWDDRSDLQALVDSPSLSTADRNAWWFDNLDIAAWVNFLATMVITGGTDCCHKNYYVYRDSEGTGQWQILPWDVDLNFGHNWNSSETYFDDDLIYTGGINHGNTVITPLYSAPGFREMYQRRVRTLMDELLQPPDTPLDQLKFEARIDELIAQIGGDAALDQAAWGFHSNMTEQTPQEAAEDLKNFYLPKRRDYLYGRSDIPDAQIEAPEIVVGKIEAEPLSGIVDEQFVRLNNPGPAAVDISGWRLTGDIDLTFRSGTVIPAGGSLFAVANVKAFLNRTSGPRGGQTRFVQGEFSGRLPATGADVRLVPFDPNPSLAQAQLRITELNYNPYDAFTALGDLDVDTDQFEFVELTNVGPETLNLEGVRFTDGFDFTFGDIDLAAGEQTLVVHNRAAFESRYATGHSIAGEFTAGRLNNGGETIRLEDDLGGVIVQFTYSDDNGWPGRADGAGATLEVVDPQADYNDPDNWQSSRWFGGTPGSVDTQPDADIIVNEVLTRTTAPATDQIELHNTSDHPVDVSGWYLSDDRDDLLQFTIPDNTTIAAGDYLVFDQTQFGFALSGTAGDDVWLLEAGVDGRPRRFADKVDFAATDLGITLGRWPNGDPNGTLFAMAHPTLGAANSGPAGSAVVISEINYNPIPAGGFFHDFDDGTDGGLLPVLGAWQVRDGRYDVTPDPDGDSLALIPAVTSPTGQLRLTATLNVPSVSDFRKNAALIFDYHGPNDFKFVLMPTGPEEWRIGQRDAEGWQFLEIVSDPLVDTDVDMEVTVELRGSTVRLVVDGLLKTNYDFGTPIEDGQLGLGSNQGEARFDNVKVEPLGDWQQFEFIEIVATASEPVDLTLWQLHGGVDMAFSPGTTIGPGETIVVVNFDPADVDQAEAFRSLFGIDQSVRLAGPYTGRLDNGGDLVRLSKPVDASNSETGLILVDQVDYDDLAPWPLEADGQGAALSRTAVTAFGGFASSWTAIAPTPGTVQIAAAGDMNLDGKVDGHDVDGFVMALNDPADYQATYGVPATATGDIDGDGDVDFDDIDGFVALVIS